MWQVADDPETLRIKQNTKIISNVAYHGDLEKKAAMEKQRGAAEVSDNLKGGCTKQNIYTKNLLIVKNMCTHLCTFNCIFCLY